MSIQAIFNKQALERLPMTLEYINNQTKERAAHHRYVALRHISNLARSLDEIEADRGHLKFEDHEVLCHLQNLDENNEVPPMATEKLYLAER